MWYGITNEAVEDGLVSDLNEMNATTASNAVKVVCQLALLGFDACIMAAIEDAYALLAYVKYLIASQETEPVSGWWYYPWLKEHAEIRCRGLWNLCRRSARFGAFSVSKTVNVNPSEVVTLFIFGSKLTIASTIFGYYRNLKYPLYPTTSKEIIIQFNNIYTLISTYLRSIISPVYNIYLYNLYNCSFTVENSRLMYNLFVSFFILTESHFILRIKPLFPDFNNA